ncbi:hypothetical protein [Luteimonas changyuni]|uniref:hypothetical protein n=1 Tax=Luteimonas sp. MJ145 TaxID=3129234 RepID=UPI0031BBBDC8
MATIPLGQFDQPRVAPRTGTSRVDLSGSMDAARAMEAAGRTAMAVGDRLLQRSERQTSEEEAKAAALRRVDMAAASTQYEVQVFEEQERFGEDLAAGRVDFRNAEREWGDRMGQLQPPTLALEGDEVMSAQYLAVTEQTRMRARAKVQSAQTRAEQAHYEASVIDTLNRSVMVAGMPGGNVEEAVARNQALEPLLRAAGYDEAKASEQIRKANQAIYGNEAKGRIEAAGADRVALDAVLQDLTGKDGRYTVTLEDPNQRLVLANSVRTRLQQLDTHAQQEANRRDEVAKRTVSDVWAQATSGVRPTSDMLVNWQAAVAGTPYEPEFTAAVGALQDVYGVIRQGPEEQAVYVQGLRAKLAAGGTPEDLARIERIEKVVASSNKQRADEPLVWLANMTGQAVEPLDLGGAIESGDVASVSVEIRSRMDAIGALRKQFGPSVSVNPLLPQEAAALSQVLDRASPRQAGEAFGLLYQATGSPEAYRAAMQQVSPDAPVRALAGMIYAEQRQATLRPGGIFRGAVRADAGDVARTILEGEALLNKSKGDKAGDGNGKFPMPTPAQFAAEFEPLVRNAFAGNPEAYDIAAQGVRAYYAGSAARVGDVSGVVDPKRVREAVRAVIGVPVDVNGGEVFPPWGMDEDAFMDGLEARWTAAAKVIPEGFSREFDDYRLRQVGNSAYRLIGAGGGFLYGSDGHPLTLDLAAPPEQRKAGGGR